jgi:hypothetical protein
MQNFDLTKCNFIPDEMDVNFNVLCPLMMYQIVCQVGCTDVVTKHQRGSLRWMPQLSKKLAKPTALSHGIGDAVIFCLSTGSRDSRLPL